MSIGKRFVQWRRGLSRSRFPALRGAVDHIPSRQTRANRIADFLSRQGISRGDVVAIESRNHPDVVITMLAFVKLGANAGMFNCHQHGAVFGRTPGLIGAKVLIYQPDLAEVLESVPESALPEVRFDFAELHRGAVLPAQSRPSLTRSRCRTPRSTSSPPELRDFPRPAR